MSTTGDVERVRVALVAAIQVPAEYLAGAQAPEPVFVKTVERVQRRLFMEHVYPARWLMARESWTLKDCYWRDGEE